MSRTTYTSTATFPLPVGWKCTKCGKINATTCDVQWSSSASKQGAFYSSKTQAYASAQAKTAVSYLVAKIIEDAQNGKYDVHFNSCVCRGCSQQEPWAAQKPNGRLVLLCLLGSFWVGLLTILSFYWRDWKSGCVCLGIVGVLLGTALVSMRLAAKRDKELAPVLAKLEDLERPVVAVSAQELRTKMYEKFAQGPEEIDAINKAVASFVE